MREEKDEAECLSLFTHYDSRSCPGNGIRLAESLCGTKLAGCGKTISGQRNFEGLHVWDKRRIFTQDAQIGRPLRPSFVSRISSFASGELHILRDTLHEGRFTGYGLCDGGLFQHPERGGSMTRTKWLLLGAVLLGLAVGLYLLFFCPTDCH